VPKDPLTPTLSRWEREQANRLLIDLRSLEVFYWVVHLGGFRRAAGKLNTTQPAVSSRIAGLESALGGPLLDRDRRRKLSVTQRGTAVLAYAERMMALHDELLTAVGSTEILRGTVRLGVSETIVHTWLSALVRRLHQVHPHVTLDIQVDISAGLRASLLAGEVDAAFLLGSVASARVRCLPLCDYPLAWVARPGLLPAARPLPLQDLAAWPILTYARGTAPHAELLQLFSRPGLPPPRIFANSSLASIVRMALDGIGIGVIAPAAIGPELRAGTLEVVQADPPLQPLSFQACWSDTPGSALAEAVTRLAQEVAGEGVPDGPAALAT